MRLDQALVQKNLCESRQEAKELISLGYVLVDGSAITKQTKQIQEKNSIVVTKRREFVSRGGHKLEGALLHIYKTRESINKVLTGKKALDIGSSTGGFTDNLLSHGVLSVIAVDVGTSQLHSKLLSDKRVKLFENTDIRYFIWEDSFDVIVADVSFISLKKIIDNIISFGKKGSIFFLLVKPQFEVGKGNTKNGIVKSQKLVDNILEEYFSIATEKGLKEVSFFQSDIKGRDGNQEYFLYGKL